MPLEKLPADKVLVKGPVSLTNGFRVAASDDKRLCVEFVAQNPFGDKETISNHITVMEEEVAKRLLDVMAEALDYYPKKPTSPSGKKKVPPKKEREKQQH